MGSYINPPNVSKEVWLAENGEEVIGRIPAFDEKQGCLPVYLVNNGPFTAAAIAYKPSELLYFTVPQDIRPKQWYIVPIEKLLTVSDLKFYLKS